MNKTKLIVYQCYGHEAIFHETVSSILSISRFPYENFGILIYTDKPAFFSKFCELKSLIEVVPISQSEITSWRGPKQFVHRFKIMMLLDVCKRHEGLVLYVDSDTVFLESPDILFHKLEAGENLLHEKEGCIAEKGNLTLKKMNRFLNRHPEFDIPARADMWNAGLIGFHTTQCHLLENVLTLTDRLYAQYAKHVMEQLAFSYIFQSQTQLTDAKKEVYHYWNFKDVRIILAKWIEQPTECFEALASSLPPEAIVQLHQPKLAYEQLPGWQKKLKKWLRSTWKMPPYTFNQ